MSSARATLFNQRSLLSLSAIGLLLTLIAACGGGGGDGGGMTTPPPDPMSTYDLSGSVTKGIVSGATVSLFDGDGNQIGSTTTTGADGTYSFSVTSATELVPPLLISVDATGAEAICDVEPVCVTGTDSTGEPIAVSFGDTYDLPDGFTLRAAITGVTDRGDETFEAAAHVSPLSDFVVRAAEDMGGLTSTNIDVANERIADLILEIFPTVGVPANLDIASVRLLDITDLSTADAEDISELSISLSALAAATAALVSPADSERSDIADVIDDLGNRFSDNIDGDNIFPPHDQARLANESVEALIGSVNNLGALVDGGELTLPDGITVEGLDSVADAAVLETPIIADIWTNLSPYESLAPVNSNGRGSADMIFLPETGEATVILLTTVDATAIHLHEGFAGQNGGVLVALEEDPNGGLGDEHHWRFPDNTVLNPDALAAVLAGRTYFNVHTEANPAGELRGQVIPANVDVIWATPNGIEPTAGFIGSEGFARGAITIDRNTADAEVHLTVLNISPTAAHVHQGVAGTTGGVVIGLEQSDTAPSLWSASSVDLTDLETAMDAGEFYFNIHTEAYPAGELRGQILPANMDLIISELEPGQITGDTPDTNASGIAAVTLDVTAGTVEVHLNLSDAVDVLSVTINDGVAGTDGDALFEGSQDEANGNHYIFMETLTIEQMMSLVDGDLYALVTTAAFPDGEIRGQLDHAGNDSDGDGVSDAFDIFPDRH
ncbi:MAG: CHRD domain-containing protein [Pseudomonadota bacterium]